MSIVEIPLTQGKVAVVDEADAPLVTPYKWYASWRKSSQTFYAATKTREGRKNSKGILMHRLITGAKPGEQVDHDNHNGLDNRRGNLRICSHAENLRNARITSRPKTSRFKGVYYRKDGYIKRWRAVVRSNGKQVIIGVFHTEEEAARAYDREALRHYGEFAMTNEDLGLYVPDVLRTGTEG